MTDWTFVVAAVLVLAVTFMVGRLWVLEDARNRLRIALFVGAVMILALGYRVLHHDVDDLTLADLLVAGAAALFVQMASRLLL